MRSKFSALCPSASSLLLPALASDLLPSPFLFLLFFIFIAAATVAAVVNLSRQVFDGQEGKALHVAMRPEELPIEQVEQGLLHHDLISIVVAAVAVAATATAGNERVNQVLQQPSVDEADVGALDPWRRRDDAAVRAEGAPAPGPDGRGQLRPEFLVTGSQARVPLGPDAVACLVLCDLFAILLLRASATGSSSSSAAKDQLAPADEGGEGSAELVEAGGVVPLVDPVLPAALQQLLEGCGRFGRRGSGAGGRSSGDGRHGWRLALRRGCCVLSQKDLWCQAKSSHQPKAAQVATARLNTLLNIKIVKGFICVLTNGSGEDRKNPEKSKDGLLASIELPKEG